MKSDTSVSDRLAVYAKVVVLLSFVLVFIGGTVTSWSAGMAVPDWPLSFGSVNPHGWWANVPVRLEHGHRLFASFVGLLIVGETIWIFREPAARHARVLAIFALLCVCLQGVFGGLRVTLETGGHYSAAMTLRIVHGCVAQAEVCLLVTLATILSPRWKEWPAFGGLPVRLGWVTAAAVYGQLIVGAAMRHLGAGLAIPTFPEASATGSWLPAIHEPYTDTNFAHTRIGSVTVTILILVLVIRVWRAARHESRLLQPAVALLALVVIQFTLGVLVIWHTKPPTLATFHVVNGALVLATTVFLALRLRRASCSALPAWQAA